MTKAKNLLTRAFLVNTYVRQGLSTWAIESKYGVSRSTVYTSLKRHSIPTRNIAQSHIRYSRRNFSCDHLEKAYLLGFTIGDLRVRNHNGNKSETISIGCGSTKQAQIDLIENLFSKYGRVWRSRPNERGVINVEAFVDHSFSFLLPYNRKYEWCGRMKNTFFAFLAGFTDAEGSFFVSDNKAFVSWGNYDKQVLLFIKRCLQKYEIETPNIYCDQLQGTRGAHGYLRNGTYCHLSISRKNIVSRLLAVLKRYVKHADKKKKLVYLQKNIMMRTQKHKIK